MSTKRSTKWISKRISKPIFKTNAARLLDSLGTEFEFRGNEVNPVDLQAGTRMGA